MLLSSVVIILREVLEGAILLSVLLALSSQRDISLRWSLPALLLGSIGATGYAANFETIAAWFDYVGQDIANATLHLLIVLSLTAFAILHQVYERSHNNAIIACMILAVAFTVVREGSEIILYLSGYMNNSEVFPSVMLGGIIGSGIGASIGTLLYYALSCFLINSARKIAYLLLSLFAAGMSLHVVTMLTQADWMASGHSLWDTSGWIDESSLTGQLLYAVTGYESTPNANQVIAYIAGILLLLLLPRLLKKGFEVYEAKS